MEHIQAEFLLEKQIKQAVISFHLGRPLLRMQVIQFICLLTWHHTTDHMITIFTLAPYSYCYVKSSVMSAKYVWWSKVNASRAIRYVWRYHVTIEWCHYVYSIAYLGPSVTSYNCCNPSQSYNSNDHTHTHKWMHVHKYAPIQIFNFIGKCNGGEMEALWYHRLANLHNIILVHVTNADATNLCQVKIQKYEVIHNTANKKQLNIQRWQSRVHICNKTEHHSYIPNLFEVEKFMQIISKPWSF